MHAFTAVMHRKSTSADHDRAPSSPQQQQQQPRRSGQSTPGTEGYPSWLPRRPSHPAPASTLPSMRVASPDDALVQAPSPTTPTFAPGGRKPTPRSVRVMRVSADDDEEEEGPYGRRVPTDMTRVNNPTPATPLHARVWSRATSARFTPTFFSGTPLPNLGPRPRFRARAFRPEELRDASIWGRLHFYLLPVLVFAHIPLQTFFDFNAAYILLQYVVFFFLGGLNF